MSDAEQRLLALYRELVRVIDLRDYCEDHDMAMGLWHMIDELEGQVAHVS